MAHTVTVIVPAFNEAAYIRSALASAVGQHHPPLEVLVIDDGSTDETAAIARSFGPPVTCVSQGNRGPSAARNHGVRLARGHWLAFLDADDVWPAGRLRAMLDTAAREPHAECVFGLVQQFRAVDAGATRSVGEPLPGICNGGMLVSKLAFDRIGSFDEDLTLADFMRWYFRVQELGVRTATCAEVVLYRRLHGANHGVRNQGSRTDEYMRVLKASLDRRRALRT